MHVSNGTPDECFICLDLAGELFNRALIHGFADSMKHEPCGFLAHSEVSADLVRGNAILAAANHPDGRQPLAKANWRVFHDRSRLGAELPLTSLALPNPASANEGTFLRLTARTGGLSFRPAELCEEPKRSVFVPKIQDGHLQSLWQSAVNCLHALSLQELCGCVKLI